MHVRVVGSGSDFASAPRLDVMGEAEEEEGMMGT